MSVAAKFANPFRVHVQRDGVEVELDIDPTEEFRQWYERINALPTPCEDCVPRSQLKWVWSYDVAGFYVPVVILPITVMVLYIFWRYSWRSQVLLRILSDHNKRDAWATSADEKAPLPLPVPFINTKAENIYQDPESHVSPRLAQQSSRVFNYLNAALELWVRAYAVTSLVPSKVLQPATSTALCTTYGQQVVAALVEGLYLKPRHRFPALTLASAWVLLFARDQVRLHWSVALRPGLFECLTGAPLALVYLAMPFAAAERGSESSGPSIALTMGAASLAGRACLSLLNSTWLAAIDNWKYVTVYSFAIYTSVMITWIALDNISSLGNRHIPAIRRLADLLHALSELAQGMFFGAVISVGVLAFLAAVSGAAIFLAACIPFRRLFYGLPPKAPEMREGWMGFVVYVAIVNVRFLPRLDRLGVEHFWELVSMMVESVPETIAVLLVVALGRFGWEVWGGER